MANLAINGGPKANPNGHIKYPILTQADRDVNSLQDVLKQVKENPGQYTYASAGVGTSIHLAGALFTYTGELDMLHVPYKGSGPAVADLVGGQVDYMFDSITSAKPHIESGKLKALAVTTAKRSSTMPELPTVAESGMEGPATAPVSHLMASPQHVGQRVLRPLAGQRQQHPQRDP